MDYNCDLCEALGNYFSTDDVEEMKFHTATKHLLSYMCLICPKRSTTENGLTDHYQQVHRKEYKRNKNKIDDEIDKKNGKTDQQRVRLARIEVNSLFLID